MRPRVSRAARSGRFFATLALVLLLLSPAATAQTAVPDCDWDTSIGFPGADSEFWASGYQEEINAVLAADLDGTANTEVYAAGAFWMLGGPDPVNGIARWDGAAWTGLLFGLDRDDAFGEALARVQDMIVWDDGSGAALYVGGDFDRAYHGPQNGQVNENSIFVGNVVRWDGSSWSALGSGLGDFGEVFALAAFDDGSGPALYAGGRIPSNVGAPVDTFGRWDGMRWESVGGHFERSDGTFGIPKAMVVFDDGNGRALYVGGRFDMAPGGVPARNIARWDGTSWTEVGGGIGNGVLLDADEVYALTVFHDGGGGALYAGGSFFEAGGVPARNIARWDGTSWSDVGGGVVELDEADEDRGGVKAFEVFNNELWVGGQFEPPLLGVARACAKPETSQNLASWDGTRWHARTHGVSGLADTPWDLAGVFSLASIEDGAGPGLYVGGFYHNVTCTGLDINGPNSISIIRCDCPVATIGGPSCGNLVCEIGDGEDCLSCPSDCDGAQTGNPANRFCCGSFAGEGSVGCSDSRCTDGGQSCVEAPALVTCCGDVVCEGSEDLATCAADCSLGTPGEASAPGVAIEQLLVTGFTPGTEIVDLTYTPACDAQNHHVYYGDLSSVSGYSYSGVECDIGDSGSFSFDPGPGSVFMMVVGHDGHREGSYGIDGTGTERPEDAATLVCDTPQDLPSQVCM